MILQLNILTLVFTSLLAIHSISLAQDRVALLIANSDYGERPLPEAKTHVETLAKALKRSGFTFVASMDTNTAQT